ncbi:MAG: OprO/OprP family phosphate-selective porin [Bacteroidales bacterium]|nr:OprO/OprP family phosphate-selective porin [Bacteroidales bacterium]
MKAIFLRTGLSGFLMAGLLLMVSTEQANAQTEVDERAVISFDKGLGFFDPDSVFGLNIRFRMQNRAAMNTISGSNLAPDNFEANVRRLRLRFDGFVGNTDFTYYLQLSFSRGDQDWDNSGFPGIVRDAMVFYNFSPNFYLGFGQGKLPGNRQRVTSSGSQQFADRSAVNAIFNIDRDFGVMAYYNSGNEGFVYRIKTAISSGEGRNIVNTDPGLAYTGRLELLPLGEFKKDGDFFEGDLFREKSPKLSLGATLSYNHRAAKTSGQRGVYLPEEQNILSSFIDLIAKFNGWAMASEFAVRSINDQQVFYVDESLLYTFTGWGINNQLSYVFPSNYEIAVRHTYVEPGNTVKWFQNKQDIYTLGFTKYMPDHKNKLQLNISYHDNFGSYTSLAKQYWNIMFQIEMGI